LCRPILSTCTPKKAAIIERKEDEKTVLYCGHRVLVMGEYAAEIWNLCDGIRTIGEIAEIVNKKYNVPHERATSDILNFIKKLYDGNLIIL